MLGIHTQKSQDALQKTNLTTCIRNGITTTRTSGKAMSHPFKLSILPWNVFLFYFFYIGISPILFDRPISIEFYAITYFSSLGTKGKLLFGPSSPINNLEIDKEIVFGHGFIKHSRVPNPFQLQPHFPISKVFVARSLPNPTSNYLAEFSYKSSKSNYKYIARWHQVCRPVWPSQVRGAVVPIPAPRNISRMEYF